MVHVGDEIVQEVNKFFYHVRMISNNGGGRQYRIHNQKNTSRLYVKHLSIIVNLETPQKLFRSNVISVLLNGLETWGVSATTTSKLRQQGSSTCLRRILKI